MSSKIRDEKLPTNLKAKSIFQDKAMKTTENKSNKEQNRRVINFVQIKTLTNLKQHQGSFSTAWDCYFEKTRKKMILF